MKPVSRTLKLSKVSAQLSLAAFVTVGLTGCSQNDCNDKTNTLPQSKIDECKENKRTTTSSGSSHTSSGYFAPYSSSFHLTSGGG